MQEIVPPQANVVSFHTEKQKKLNFTALLDQEEGADEDKIQIEFVKQGDEARLVDETLDAMRKIGGLYERGPQSPEIVYPSQEGMISMNEAWLRDWLSRHVNYYVIAPKKAGNLTEAPVNVPKDLVMRIVGKKVGRGLPFLRGVISAPTMRLDGTIISEAGYDAETQLLLKPRRDEVLVRVPDLPTRAELEKAVETLWYPFKGFPLASKADRGVLLSAIMTAAVRRVLPTAPGYGVEAAMPGSGKTKCAGGIAELLGGSPTPTAHTTNEDEMRKRLFAAQRSGDPCIFIDNIEGVFASSALCGFLTSPMFGDRILGASENDKLPTNIMFFCTGNNLSIQGDLWRRILRIRIDPQMENPDQRDFDFDPVLYCRTHRQEIISAVLTIMRAYVLAGRPKMSKITMGSFEDWDAMVRQPILWMIANKLTPQEEGQDVDDPYEAVKEAKLNNPEIDLRNSIFEGLAALYPYGREFSIGKMIDKLMLAETEDTEIRQEIKEQLKNDLFTIASSKNCRDLQDRAARTTLGYWFRRNENVYGGGKVLQKAVGKGKHKGSQFYRVTVQTATIGS